MEGDVILLQDIFHFRPVPGAPTAGELVANGLRPKFLDRLTDMSIEVPAASFKSAASAADRLAAAGVRNGRKVRIPSERELADREALR
jgi:hypothetical protein